MTSSVGARFSQRLAASRYAATERQGCDTCALRRRDGLIRAFSPVGSGRGGEAAPRKAHCVLGATQRHLRSYQERLPRLDARGRKAVQLPERSHARPVPARERVQRVSAHDAVSERRARSFDVPLTNEAIVELGAEASRFRADEPHVHVRDVPRRVSNDCVSLSAALRWSGVVEQLADPGRRLAYLARVRLEPALHRGVDQNEIHVAVRDETSEE